MKVLMNMTKRMKVKTKMNMQMTTFLKLYMKWEVSKLQLKRMQIKH